MFDVRWGVVTFLDFYIGASVIGVWICVMEKSIFRGVFGLFVYTYWEILQL